MLYMSSAERRQRTREATLRETKRLVEVAQQRAEDARLEIVALERRLEFARADYAKAQRAASQAARECEALARYFEE